MTIVLTLTVWREKGITAGRARQIRTLFPPQTRKKPRISMTPFDEKEIKAPIRSFISSSVNLPDFKDDENLFELGIVNSLFAVQLMTFIETTFALEVGTDDLDIENFKSLNAMTAFVLIKNRG